jgi:alkanesulfonate monooxygenase SsuD/methylene tetrahydromethanopterin reductase-like flavin-dependent oxidoreductase (luciferase family)
MGEDGRMTTLGVVFLPYLPPERLTAVAQAADDAGLDELWLWEDCFREGGISAAAVALAGTDRLQLGIGLLPVPLRNVALTAMEAATLERMFPGRIKLGVGHGVQDWMAQVGARVESPMTLLREYVLALRALLRGERVSTEGRYVRLDDVGLDWPPASPAPVLVGAMGPRTLRLAGEVADGTIITGGNSSEQVRELREGVEAGRQSSGRDDPHEVVVFVHAATGHDAAERLDAERSHWGFDSMDGIAVSGDAPAVAEGVTRYVAAGADAVILQPTRDDPDPEGFACFVATEVRPLLP